MRFATSERVSALKVERFFEGVFAASEGRAEGERIGRLVRELIAETGPEDLRGFIAEADGELLGAIFFSRLSFQGGGRVFLLSPVAVHQDYQGKGIGQQLIRHGLEAMRGEGISIVATYGDPALYGKVGFEGVPVEQIPAPFPLSQPIGWLALSLDGSPLAAIEGPSRCVGAG